MSDGSVGPTGEDPRDLAAAEYVLGTLPADERAAFARRLAADDDAREAVRAWERRLAPLGLSVPEVAPPRGLWERIARALPGPPPLAAAGGDRSGALRRQVRTWRATAAGAGLVAAGLALFVMLRPLPTPEADARYVAVVTSGGAVPALLVTIDTRAGTAQVRPVGAETPAGRSLELWFVGSDETPRPLGVVGAGAERVTLPESARAQARAGEGVFAVSVEPPGGSPTGQPTGPVIYTGKLIPE